MIRSSELDAAAARLDGVAGRLDEAGSAMADAHRTVTSAAGALPAAWGGPLPDLLNTTTTTYAAAVDGRPIADAAPVVRRWSSDARARAESLRALEARRSSTVRALGRVRADPTEGVVVDPEISAQAQAAAEAAAEDRRRQLRGDLAAIDQEVERHHDEWTRTCAAYAGTLDTYTAALRAQAARSAIAEYAAAGGSFSALDPRALGAWVAGLDDAELAAIFADPRLAQGWWDSLSDEDRIAFVASRPGGVGGALGDEVEAWKATLDSDGVRALYTAIAMAKAGIDPALWDPSTGYAANATTVHAVYDYYSSLYLAHPDQLWWAGMASMIGPSFVAGMADLSDVGTVAEALRRLGTLGQGPASLDAVTRLSAAALAEELKFYETMLLRMQKEIFLDMAVAHEAYLGGGMQTIERLYAGDPYRRGGQVIDAWRDIDLGLAMGDATLIASGNRDLLYREQRYVIDDDYRRMLERPVTGEVFTYVFTAAGAPSIPGAVGFAELYPIEVERSQSSDDWWGPGDVPFIGPWARDAISPVEAEITVGTATPLPDGNIARFDDRWRLIEEDTLPVYVDLVADDPAEARRILAEPLVDRMQEWRIIHRLDEIMLNWEPYVEVEVRQDGSVWGAIGDAWDWAFGGDDGGPSEPVEVPTGTTSPDTTLPQPDPAPAPAPVPTSEPTDQGPPTGTLPSPMTSVPGG